MRAILRHSAALAWLFDLAFSALLAATSAAAVLLWAPAAAGSGVPEVIAYLNGCELRRVFSRDTAAAKLVACALAVSSGLPVGPEGPMIFLGASAGALLTDMMTAAAGGGAAGGAEPAAEAGERAQQRRLRRGSPVAWHARLARPAAALWQGARRRFLAALAPPAAGGVRSNEEKCASRRSPDYPPH